MVERINQFRKWILLISQILGAGICIYFILNAPNYEVSWSLLSWLFPSVVNKINLVLSFIGTYILVIPLTIIILSLLLPQNIPLKIMSTFFGIAGTLILLVSGFFRNTLSEVYNMRIFLVTKILPLDEKINIFKEEYLRIIDTQYNDSLLLYNHLQERLLEKYFTVYENYITLLKERIAIKVYANDVIQGLVNSFKADTQYDTTIEYYKYLKYGGYVIGAVATVFLVAAIIRYFTVSDAIIESTQHQINGATLSLQGAELNKAIVENLTETIIKTNIFNTQFTIKTGKDLMTAVSMGFMETEQRLHYIETTLKQLKDATEVLTDTIIK